MAKRKFETRDPLEERETVTPVHLRPNSQQASMPAQSHASKTAPAGDKQYTTYLRASSIKALKRFAFEKELPATEVMQTALDDYLKAQEAPIDL
jgi:hypothetical protein